MNGARVSAFLFGGAALTGVVGLAGLGPGASPVNLRVTKSGPAVTLALVGAASEPIRVAYSLDVRGASAVHQSGQAQLVPDGGETLTRVTIDGERPWRATMHVVAKGVSFDQFVDSSHMAQMG